MSPEENKALARRFFVEVVSDGKLELVDEIFAASFLFNGQPMGPETVKQVIADLRAAFPDLEATIENQVAEGDLVSTQRTVRGTHLGEYVSSVGRIPPTGKRVEWRQLSIVRLADGKVAEDWVVSDNLGLLRQLGAEIRLPA